MLLFTYFLLKRDYISQNLDKNFSTAVNLTALSNLQQQLQFKNTMPLFEESAQQQNTYHSSWFHTFTSEGKQCTYIQ